MATTYVKGKLRKTSGSNIEVRYPETTLDKVVAWVNGSTAGVTILDGGRIKKDYLPSSAVYTSGGKIDSSVIPSLTTSIISGGTFTSAFLPSNVVYTSGGKIDSGVVPGLNASIITGGTFGTARLPNIPVSQLAVSGGTIAQAILPSIPAANITGVINKTNLPGSVDDIVELKAIAASAPSATGIVTGDQYFNTTSKKIVTAVSDGTWTGATESNPDGSVIYYVPSTEKSYRYGGTAMLEIAAQRAVTTTVRPSGTGGASDDFVPTELAVRNAITSAGTPFASQEEVNAGTIDSKAVSPATLAGTDTIPHIVDLDGIAATLPGNADEGEIWYSSSDELIHTKTASGWDNGVAPSGDVFYRYGNYLYVYSQTNQKLVEVATALATDSLFGVVKLATAAEVTAKSGTGIPSVSNVASIIAASGKADSFTVSTTHGLTFTNRELDLSLNIVGGTISGSTIFCDLEWAADQA